MNGGYGNGGGFGGRGFGGGGFGGGGSFSQPPVNFAEPWLDGHYPSYDLNDRSQYYQPYGAAAPPMHGNGHTPAGPPGP
jgi:hypothetical protein